ncbi:hypothetical protein BH24ACT22_BH24ACT22_13860 [soil metagenome]
MVIIHTGAAIFAILCGILVLILEKGTSTHKMIGKIYATAILTLCVFSIFIQEINGGFSIFHLISIQTTVFVIAGLCALLLRNKLEHWYVWHLRFMLYSYVTLVVTGIAQAFEYLPFESGLLNAVVFIQAPAFVGWALIEFRGVPRWRGQFGSLSASSEDVS